ncbi:bifunctional transcriptional activator/DNA repair enzyme AdaA [Pseudoalteromonas luteoviolacea]|uniref:bifunctional transcriptional activator/DNA repair enzyme AdaA n=1 Tax=Pseudoalteromonas luteoviolacea TaxID=43657 RepID=UPI001B364D6C|nr:methylated-DNA--[protein]-cysteine S-methyltransferase [Pseudoalteromonas luteoviolacea]MBQ4838016.1 methylated-DNA--[protein]-cysteine S-methyltransferase [Pseudoalteromonas luteoviolacea]
MMKLTEAEMAAAVNRRDPSFDGQFYYGVITTGVFCQPSCPTKSAKPENLRFFYNQASALAASFRPCKRCNPIASTKKVDTLINVARHIEKHADEKLTLVQLGKVAGLSPSQLQRSFKTMFGVSPKHYQDAVRMRQFKCHLRAGEGITDAIYSSGFGSISRVYGETTRNIGMSPKAYRAGGQGEVIYYACRETSLGHMVMAATSRGVCSVQFGDNQRSLINLLSEEFPKAKLVLSKAQDAPELDNWIHALDNHISHGAPKPDVPLDIIGTAFQIKVWQFLLSIKEGEVISYGEIAAQIDNPKAVRAVGTACGKNRIGILIPCHRVLRSDGTLGGYRWGLERKKALLAKEGVKKQ